MHRVPAALPVERSQAWGSRHGAEAGDRRHGPSQAGRAAHGADAELAGLALRDVHGGGGALDGLEQAPVARQRTVVGGLLDEDLVVGGAAHGVPVQPLEAAVVEVACLLDRRSPAEPLRGGRGQRLGLGGDPRRRCEGEGDRSREG